MFFSRIASVAALAGAALASPTPTINEVPSKRELQKRADITEAASLGFASANGGTTGGAGGSTTTVTDLASFSEAAESEEPLVIVIEGSIQGPGKVRPASDKTIVGASGGADLENVGIYVRRVSNVIIRNLRIARVDADNGDAIGVDGSTNVWVDHVDLEGDLNVGKDDYDGLFDVTHASDYVTISYSYFHNHWKGSLIGHSDSNADEDTGHLRVTYAHNHWVDVNSRNPSIRFGTLHVYNSLYENLATSGINTRMGAQALIESTAFVNAKRAVTTLDSDDDGFAVLNDVDLGGSDNSAPEGTISGSDLPYTYELVGAANVASAVADVGATLNW